MIKIQDGISLHGNLIMRIFKKGRLVEEHADHNMIVDMARYQMVRLVAGDVSGRHITKIAFGTNGNLPKLTDKAITNSFTKAITRFKFPSNNKVQFDWDLSVSENNGMAISELGLLTDDGTLFARIIREKPFYKESDISIEGQWTLIL